MATGNFKGFGFGFHSELPVENESVFIEFWTLPWFSPAFRRSHMCNAYCAILRIYESEILVDNLGFISGGLNACRGVNKFYQSGS